METYSFLRELADSWALLALTLFFLGTIIWAFRPGSRKIHRDAADIPFRNASATPGKETRHLAKKMAKHKIPRCRNER